MQSPEITAAAAAIAAAATVPVPDDSEDDLSGTLGKAAWLSTTSYQAKTYFGMCGQVMELGPFWKSDLDQDTPPSVTVAKLKKKFCELHGPALTSVLNDVDEKMLADKDLCTLEEIGSQGSQGIALRILPTSIPGKVYTLMVVEGDDGCCHWSGQSVRFSKQSYAIAEEAAANAASHLLAESGFVELEAGYAEEGESDVSSFEFDNRKDPKNCALLAIYGSCCYLVELSLRTIKDDTVALAKLTDHVYCLVSCHTDEGQPMHPQASWDKSAFVDVQSAAHGARKFWGIENIAASKAEGDTEFGDYTDNPAEMVCKQEDGGVVLHSYNESLRIRKVMLPREPC